MVYIPYKDDKINNYGEFPGNNNKSYNRSSGYH